MSYTCLNTTCAIALSKATFPVVMNCPVCQQPLQEVLETSSISETDEQLIATLPYVIAYPLKRALTEKHAWTRVNLLKDTFLNYLKYLGLVSASEFFHSPLKDKKMVALFQQALAEPSFGSWNQYIRETLKFLNEKQHHFFCSDLPKYYEAIETGGKRKLYKGEIEFIDSNGDVQLKKQEATAIGMLINFRNRYLGHGLTLDETAAQQLWDEYFPMFRALLEQLQFAAHYPMFKHEHGETYRLQSSELTVFEKGTQSPARVWMENPQGESMDILPFFVVPGEVSLGKDDKEQILAYESYTGKTIRFFSPEGTEKQTSGKILEKLNLLLRDKQKEHTYTPEEFTKEIFLARVADENKLIIDTLVAEKKVIPGVYVHREEMEIKLREWVGARANIFVMAAEAGSGKTNLLVEIQKQYTSREMPSLLIRAGRMEKTTFHAQLCYLLNINEHETLAQYPALAGTQEAPTFVLIDGLNEAHDAEKLWFELFEISKQFEPGSLKFVVTSRANTAADINRYAITSEQESFLYGNSKDKETRVSAYTHWLTALSMEEMKQAWEGYVAKDKSKFKPLFDFDDLATFDRALYSQISNPLVLRLFLETYQGKNLPKKGKLHLGIWSDWLSSFTQPEQEFFTALADAIWDKGENELLLDDVLKDNQLNHYFTNDQLNAPYPRLRNLGWISRYVKDLNACIGFTVEGALLHLLGKKLGDLKPPISLQEIQQILRTGSPLQKAGVGAYLHQRALLGDMNTVCELIDTGEEFIETCVTPIVLHLKSIGVKETLDILLQNPTEHDWKALLKVDDVLKELTLNPLRKELAIHGLPKNDFSLKTAIQLGLKGIQLIDKEEGESFLSKINLNQSHLLDDAQICNNLGDLFGHFGEYDKALEFYQQCLDIELKTLGDQHPDVANTYNSIGETCWFKGEFYKALEFHQKSLDIRLKTLGNLHPDVAHTYANIGSTWSHIGEYDKALEFQQQALDIRVKILGNQHPDVANSYNNIGTDWHRKGEYDKALEFLQQSLSIYIQTFGNQHPRVAITYSNIGTVWRYKGEFHKALEFLQQSLDIKLKTLGNQHPDVARSYDSIGSAWRNKGEYEKALEYYQKCLDIYLQTFGNQHPDVADSYYNIGSTWYNKGEYDNALKFYQQCLDARLKILGGRHPDVVTSHEKIGNCQRELKMYQLAIQSFKACFEIQKEAGYLFQIAKCYEALSENRDALGYYIQSAEIRKEDPDLGIGAESTQESFEACIRLAKELGKESELPEWIKNNIQ
jgi:tetratricopeptide (TPR) repeat protein